MFFDLIKGKSTKIGLESFPFSLKYFFSLLFSLYLTKTIIKLVLTMNHNESKIAKKMRGLEIIQNKTKHVQGISGCRGSCKYSGLV